MNNKPLDIAPCLYTVDNDILDNIYVTKGLVYALFFAHFKIIIRQFALLVITFKALVITCCKLLSHFIAFVITISFTSIVFVALVNTFAANTIDYTIKVFTFKQKAVNLFLSLIEVIPKVITIRWKVITYLSKSGINFPVIEPYRKILGYYSSLYIINKTP